MSDTGLLTPPPGDASVRMLDAVLGPGWASYYAPSGGDMSVEAAHSASALAQMLGGLNSIALAIGGLMFAYMLLIGVIGTAHEGTPLGKRYSTLWVPLRGVLAAAMLMPLPWTGGFSVLQATVLVFTNAGIGAASSLQQHGLDYMRDHLGTMSAPVLAQENHDLTRTTLQIQIARQAWLQMEGYAVPGWESRWVMENPPKPEARDAGEAVLYAFFDIFEDLTSDAKYDWATGYYEYTFPPPPKTGLALVDMGAIEVPCVQDMPEMCQERVNAMHAYLDELWIVAGQIVSNFAGGAELEIDPRAAKRAERALAEVMHQSGLDHLSSQSPHIRQRVNDFVGDVEDKGWVALGAYHGSMAGFQEQVIEAIQTSIGQLSPDRERLLNTFDRPRYIVQYWEWADELAASDGTLLGDERMVEHAEAAGRGIDEDGGVERVGLLMSEAFKWIPDAMNDALMSGDPVAGISGVASGVLNTVQGVVAGAAIWSGAKWAFSKLPVVGGVAEDEPPKASGGLGGLANMILLSAVGMIIITSMVLAFYLPAVMFVIWTMAVVGWLIQVLEMLVAAPVWALAHMMPEGEGFAGQRGQQGYMLFFNVLLRPPLMVIGFFIAIALIGSVGLFIGAAMKLYWANTSGGFMFIFGLIAYLILLTVLVVTTAHKIFGLVSWLPDNVIKWIGGAVNSLGDMQDTQVAKQSVYAGFGAIGQVSGSAASHQSRAAVARQGSGQGRLGSPGTGAGGSGGGGNGLSGGGSGAAHAEHEVTKPNASGAEEPPVPSSGRSAGAAGGNSGSSASGASLADSDDGRTSSSSSSDQTSRKGGAVSFSPRASGSSMSSMGGDKGAITGDHQTPEKRAPRTPGAGFARRGEAEKKRPSSSRSQARRENPTPEKKTSTPSSRSSVSGSIRDEVEKKKKR